jgi:hypothetical protein
MKKASESAVDRLIALALDQKPARPVEHPFEEVPLLGDHDLPHDLSNDLPHDLPNPRDLEHNPMWKGLLQLRAFLPYIARVLEMSSPTQTSTALVSEVRQSVGALESAHHDLRVAVAEQTVELKQIEQSLTKTQEATERNTFELTELGDDVKSMRSLVKTALVLLTVLVVALLGTVGYLAWKLPHLH